MTHLPRLQRRREQRLPSPLGSHTRPFGSSNTYGCGQAQLALGLHRSRTSSTAQPELSGPSRTFTPGATPALQGDSTTADQDPPRGGVQVRWKGEAFPAAPRSARGWEPGGEPLPHVEVPTAAGEPCGPHPSPPAAFRALWPPAVCLSPEASTSRL